MTSRYLFLAFLLIGGVLVTDTVWAESSHEIQTLAEIRALTGAAPLAIRHTKQNSVRS